MITVADFLAQGVEHAVPRQHLMTMTGLTDRELRRKIERERRAGALILSDNQHGYYLSSSAKEAQRFARSMQGRAREILTTAQAIERAVAPDG